MKTKILNIPKDTKILTASFKCPSCKKGKVYNYLNPLIKPYGAYKVGDWVCYHCDAVFNVNNNPSFAKDELNVGEENEQ